ncbi:retinol dehydrogenase 13-like isoform X1 [Uloborus diversus]|uniref:retinol dehydrogenase 13-like isoform X1 n=1 Tax=Uloborus diversus TaxID=327109 RepID=UPI00240A855B|nr:retinol dehydrogenase 13-like isoform X1 [Uloborus diversus]
MASEDGKEYHLQDVPLHGEDIVAGSEQIESDSNTTCCAPVAGSLVYLHGFVIGKICRSTALLHGKTVIITGGNTGIGKQTALDLARRGAKVIIACRDLEKGKRAEEYINDQVPNAKVLIKSLDLASFKSIRRFASEILQSEPKINILINNAGVAACPKWLTEDGYEMQFGTNHLGHFLLTTLLLDRIKASAPARIVNVSSLAHIFGNINFKDINLDRGYQPLLAYCRSKLANILFTKELANRLKGTGVTTYCLHPGAVHTELGRHMGTSFSNIMGRIYHVFSRAFFKSAYKGAQTTIFCAVDESLANESGYYYSNCSKVAPSRRARDAEMAKKLWELSESFVKTE